MAPAFAGDGEVNHEVWRCAKLLRRHEGDVLDLAWSADGRRLASGSIDNTVRCDAAPVFDGTKHQ